jgi:cytochrome c oxidase subunit 3
MWVALASILMLFTALTSAYIVRAASSSDWKSLPMPRILLLSTTLIIVSSVTLEFAKRQLKSRVKAHTKAGC